VEKKRTLHNFIVLAISVLENIKVGKNLTKL